MADPLAVSIDRLPTLTEVLELGRDFQGTEITGYGEPPLVDLALAVPVRLELPEAVSVSVSAPAAAPIPPPLPAALPAEAPFGAATAAPNAFLDHEAIVTRVLAELEPRVAALLEARVSEALAPALARFSEVLIHEARLDISGALRALVQESLEQALRHRDEYR